MAKPKLPFPGPTGGAALRTLDKMRLDPLPGCDELHARYGDRIAIQALGYRYAMLQHPDDIQALFVKAQHHTHKGEALKQVRKFMGNQLLVVEDEQHAEQRKVLAPAFAPRRLDPYPPIFATVGKEAAHGWGNGPIDAEIEMNRVDLMIAGRALFGDTVDPEITELGAALHQALSVYPLALHPLRPIIEKTTWFGPMKRVLQARERLNTTVQRLIDEGRAREARGQDNGDVLSILIRHYDGPDGGPEAQQTLMDEARGMLMGGHETAANTLAWGLHLLAANPDVQERIHDEVREVCGDGPITTDNWQELKVTNAAIQEALRLYPAGGIHIRAATAPVELPEGPAGPAVTLPAGTEFLVSAWTLHRDERFWPDPLRYDVERWLDPDPDRPRFAFIPWGGGKRICLGAAYATMLGTVLFAEMMRHVRLELPPGAANPEAISVFTVRPKNGLPMIVHQRAGDRTPAAAT